MIDELKVPVSCHDAVCSVFPRYKYKFSVSEFVKVWNYYKDNCLQAKAVFLHFALRVDTGSGYALNLGSRF